ncbi:hypothetical protein PV08_00869 [Exophiala spinifera]|uniref:Xylanolytic transcriptional activator regulatory domain-containing protein n=1 Tax=Exophiala spinifera TaxID=91928 RepID=A0A0D2C9N2_9EURO|nr:uncharacterized protein PV08_00869 [Exophiala spinifera]KIW20294.1 hypothetical protein PV08_00869 [Exophiala spinifera]
MAWKRPIRRRMDASTRPNTHDVTESVLHTSTRSAHKARDEDESTHESQEGLDSEALASQGLARTSLSQFFQHGLPSSKWDVFNTLDRMRIVYIGTKVSNLSHLISLDQSSRPFLVYPHPEIHPSPSLTSRTYTPSAAQDSAQDIYAPFSKELRGELIESFFSKVHPIFPVVDEQSFRSKYDLAQDERPLLLLYAIMLVGAHVSQDAKVKRSRCTFKSLLFKRGKWLFDMRHENDRQHLVAAALLFTWHLENADTVSMNAYYWSGVACRTAYGIGMHRNILAEPDTPDRMPWRDRRLYRRTWWTLFQVEVMSALEHGRPSMIRLEDFDQGPLDARDFDEIQGSQDTLATHIHYCARNIELCYIVVDLLRLTSPGILKRDSQLDLETFQTRLANWAIGLPMTTDFWSLQLQLHYHCVVLHLFRLHSRSGDFGLGSINSVELCSGATRAILSVFETMAATDVLNQCYSTSVMALTAAAIYLSKEIQRSITNGAVLVALNHVRDLERVFPIATALSEYWPNADGLLKLFTNLADKFKILISDQQQPPAQQEGFDINALNEINWEDIFAYSHHHQSISTDDWMNTWPGLEK